MNNVSGKILIMDLKRLVTTDMTNAKGLGWTSHGKEEYIVDVLVTA